MIEQDTIKLLRECDAGIKMGISAIDEVMKYVKNEELKKVLQNGMKDNEESKKLAKKLISIEEDLSSNLRKFL